MIADTLLIWDKIELANILAEKMANPAAIRGAE